MRYLIVILNLFFSLTLFAQDYWQQLKGPEGGNVGTLSQGADGTLYLISPLSGYHQSTDNGINWTRMKTPFNSYEGSQLATNSKNEIFISLRNLGLFRSQDHGQSFDLIFYDNMISWSSEIVIDSKDRIFYLTGAEIFISTDDGISFSKFIERNITNGSVDNFYSNGKSLMYIAASKKIISTSDGGINWKIDSFDININSMKVNGLEEPFIFFFDSVLYSQNKGLSWNKIPLPGKLIANTDLTLGNGSDLYFRSDNDSILLSTNYGKTWSNLLYNKWNNLIIKQWIGGDELFIDRNNKIYKTNPLDGFWKFDANLNHWLESNQGLYCHHIDGIQINSQNKLFALTSKGIFRTVNDDNTWEFVNSNYIFDDYDPDFIYVNKKNDDLYQGSGSVGLYKSIDNGDTWKKVNVCNNCNRVFGITSDKNGVLYACTRVNTYKSLDDGLNWTKLDSFTNYPFSYIYSGENGWILVGGKVNLFLSKDGGISWNDLHAPYLMEWGITEAYADKDNTIFSIAEFLPPYKKIDDTSSWKPLNVNWPGGSVDFKVLPNDDYMVSGRNGVYISKDKGDNWILSSSGLFDNTSTFFTLDSKGTIYLGSQNSGIYKSSEKITGLKNVEIKKNLIQILYSKDHIHLSVESKQNQNFDLSILNLDGKLIKTFSHQQLQSGKNEIELLLNGLTSGIYFYQMYLKSQVYSGKFTVSQSER